MRIYATSALSLLFTVTSVTAETLSNIRDQHQSFQERLADQDRRIALKNHELEDLSKKIVKLKSNSDAPTFWSNYRLENALRDAQELSSNIENLQIERKETEAALEKNQEELIAELSGKIRKERRAAQRPGATSNQRKQSANKLEKYLREMALLRDRPSMSAASENASGMLAGQVRPEDLQARLNALKDFVQVLYRDRTIVQGQLRELRERHFLRRELGHLLDEEAFFSEQGFIQTAGRRDSQDSVQDLSRLSPSQSPPSAPPGKSTPPSVDNVPDVDPVTGSEMTSLPPGSLNSAGREVGLPPDHSEPLLQQAGRDAKVTQIAVIQERLETLQSVIRKMEEHSKHLESQLRK